MSDADEDSDRLDSAFTWTNEMTRITIWTAAAPTIAALVASLLALGLACTLYCRTRLRYALRRQSFLMLLASLVASLIYCAAYLAELLISGPTPWCNVVMFFGFLTSNFINSVIMCIALNLQLVFVHRKSTEGWLKYYLTLSFLLSLALSLPGAIREVWGWDPITLMCYTSLTDPRQRRAWQIASGYFWMLFSALITLCCTLTVLSALVCHGLQRRREFTETQRSNTDYNQVARAVAWRITIYPCITIIVNCIAAASDFSIDQSRGIDTYAGFVLWNVYGFCYGAQPLLFALVALFVDPSFSSAVRSLLFGEAGTRHSTQTSSVRPRNFGSVRSDIVELTRPQDISSVKTEQFPCHPECHFTQTASLSPAALECADPAWDVGGDKTVLSHVWMYNGDLEQM